MRVLQFGTPDNRDLLVVTDATDGDPSVAMGNGTLVVDPWGDGVVVSNQLVVRGNAQLYLGTFRVPSAPIPYDATPTAESLRDALVAAGYMAAPEGE